MPESHRLPARRGPRIEFTFEGEPIAAHEGETLATALLGAGVQAFGTTREGDPRAPLCNMGTCFDCAVTVDGRQLIRACLTPVADGMDVQQTKGH